MKNTATSKKLIVLIWFLLPALTMAAIDTPTITVDPDTTNYYAGYTISSSISDDIYSLSAGVDSFIIIFDSSTVVPSSINPSQIAVNSNICTSVNVTGQRLSILSPVTLGGIFFNPTDFTIEINKEAGIRNPSTAGTDSLQAATTKTNDTELVTSTPYNIYASTSSISPASVIPNPSLADESAAYNIVFDVGQGGYLVGGSDKISIVFPSGTTVPAGALSGVTVNGTPATAIAIGDTVNVTTPNDVDNEGTVNINFAFYFNFLPARLFSLGGHLEFDFFHKLQNALVFEGSTSLPGRPHFNSMSCNSDIVWKTH